MVALFSSCTEKDEILPNTNSELVLNADAVEAGLFIESSAARFFHDMQPVDQETGISKWLGVPRELSDRNNNGEDVIVSAIIDMGYEVSSKGDTTQVVNYYTFSTEDLHDNSSIAVEMHFDQVEIGEDALQEIGFTNSTIEAPTDAQVAQINTGLDDVQFLLPSFTFGLGYDLPVLGSNPTMVLRWSRNLGEWNNRISAFQVVAAPGAAARFYNDQRWRKRGGRLTVRGTGIFPNSRILEGTSWDNNIESMLCFL